MVFSSLIFLFAFLPFVLVGNFVWRKNRVAQNGFLLFASLFFYAWGEGERVLVMLISIIANFYIGKQLEDSGERKRFYLIAGIIVNLSLLGYFKYAFFIADNFNLLLDGIGIDRLSVKEEKLPIGISFYTFQALSYLVDVYRGTSKAQKNFLNLGLYITLFPQLIAGPIVRYNDIAHQLKERKESIELFTSGIRRFLIGFSKKVLIANSLGSLVDQLFYLPPSEMSTGLLWVGMVTYSLQLYFDFSGYSDMAIGLGRMFGFRITENFNFPYIARSIQDFWRRWHITLSVWFRDYLYIPLGGNRVSPTRVYFNLFVVFLLTGLWHGAGWNFIIWGLFHGAFLILERIGLSNLLNKAPKVIGHLYTLLVAGFAWVLFRAKDFDYGFSYWKGMLISNESFIYSTQDFLSKFYIFWLCIAILFATPLMKKLRIRIQKHSIGSALSDISLLFFFTMGIIELMTSTYNPFIYFRF